ncbi:MTH865 family protein [Methanospirillum sp.]|nr:MTH865 family protein [Methanospirillum sp.]
MSAFPAGADTSCQVENLKMTAGEAGKLLKASDFPFQDAK